MIDHDTAFVKLEERWHTFAEDIRSPEANLAWALPIRNVLPWALNPLWEDIGRWGAGVISSFTSYGEYGWMEIAFPRVINKYSIGFESDSSGKILFWNKSFIERRRTTESWLKTSYSPLKVISAHGSSEINPQLWTEYYLRICETLSVEPLDEFLCYRFATSTQKADLLGLDPTSHATGIVWGATDPISGDIVSNLYFDPHEIVHVAAKGMMGWPDPLLAEGLAETFKQPYDIESFVLDRWIPLDLALRMLPCKHITIPALRIQMSLFIRYLLHKQDILGFHTFYGRALPGNIGEAVYFAYGSQLSELDEEARTWVRTYGLKEAIRDFDLTQNE